MTEPIKWQPAPESTRWGYGMVVADVAIDADHTLTLYCEADHAARVVSVQIAGEESDVAESIKPQFDPLLHPPEEVIRAADLVGRWAAERDITNWQIGPCASRIELAHRKAQVAAREARLDAMGEQVRELKRETEILRAERNAARARYDHALKVMIGIHNLTLSPPLKLGDGRTLVCRPPDAAEILQALSDRIRAIPDDLAKADADARWVWVVLDKDGEFVYGLQGAHARDFCHDHIKDAVSEKIPGANKWVVRRALLDNQPTQEA